MALRRAAVAGTWYPSTAARLIAELDVHLRLAGDVSQDSRASRELVALVAPHAGLMYSGPVAAYAYRLLKDRTFETIILVGPSHYVAFEGASIWRSGEFETPLGNLRIDEEIASLIAETCPVIADVPSAHGREHSLEMQLPFLAKFAPDTPIVPIVMGHQSRATAYALGDGIRAAVADRKALLIASSDLSHFYDAATAAALDERVIVHVNALDPDGLMTQLEQRADHACGGGPMVSVLHAAKGLGATSSEVLRHADSSDVSGDKSSVVGYMAAAVWR